jgi:hypothetical protein
MHHAAPEPFKTPEGFSARSNAEGLTRERLVRTVFSFGNVRTQSYGCLALKSDGAVAVYDHANERRYDFDGERLTFLSAEGRRGVEVSVFCSGDDFVLFARDGHYLTPVVELAAEAERSGAPKIIVNTVPKSGTYFCGRICEWMGFRPVRLHLSAQAFIDNRGLRAREIHRDTQSRGVSCPASAVAAVMADGEYAVAHIEAPDQIACCRAQGASIIHCVRDLRDALVSLWRFKIDTVGATSPTDEVWRAVQGPDQFLAFLSFYAERDVRHLIDCAHAICIQPDPKLRFEDLSAGLLTDRAARDLDALVPGLAPRFAEGLADSVGKPTSTLSERHADHHEIWSSAAQRFYEISGLREANRALGYDLGAEAQRAA